MTEHGLAHADLVPVLGMPSIVSEALAGKCDLAPRHIARLAGHFSVPADGFISRITAH